MRPFAKTLTINALVLAALLAGVEIFFRTVHPIPDLWNTENSKIGWRWRESGWRTWLIETGVRGAYFWDADEANQLGFRGQKISYEDGDFVTLLIGDSQVEAAASRLEEMPEAILQHSFKGAPTRMYGYSRSVLLGGRKTSNYWLSANISTHFVQI